MIIIYHNKDLDGFASAAICMAKYPNALLVGYDYGNVFPLQSKDLHGREVIMIDVSLPMPEMLAVANSATHLTWIDHHRSAIADYVAYFDENKSSRITAVLQDGIAACEIAWKHFFPDKPIPEAIKLLGEYDTWRNGDKDRWDNVVMPFQYGMREVCHSPESFPPILFMNDAKMINYVKLKGDTILSYQKMMNNRAAKTLSFEAEFLGFRAICMNSGGANSQLFESVYDENKHDIMMPFVFNGKLWKYSIYTTKDGIDCSALAKKMGGGGHLKAAGFETDFLLEEFQPPIAVKP